MSIDESEGKRKSLENLILLVLGADNKKISQLHLQKEIFLLWNFHPSIKEFVYFIKHYKGPFSQDVKEAIINPIFLEDCWVYEYSNDELSGGYIYLNNKGKNEYLELVKKIKQKNSIPLSHLLNGVKLIRKIYDNVSMEELLLLIYRSYPKYTQNSYWKERIEKNKEYIAKQLLVKNIIDSKKYKELLEERLI